MNKFNAVFTLLRIPFSFFLMPVFWFAISQCPDRDAFNTYLIFIVLHLFIYPASNGYNSYIDKDETSIGGIKNPPKATKELLYASIVLDGIGILLATYVHLYFAAGITLYMLISRAYSWDGIRIKKFAVASFLVVSVFQGGYIYLLVYLFAQPVFSFDALFDVRALLPALICTVNISAVYPLTQIYQHKADAEAGVNTISRKLGIKRTFLFSSVFLVFSALLMVLYFNAINQNYLSMVFFVFMFPVILFYVWWVFKAINNSLQASYRNTMLFNGISSTFNNLFFITLIILKQF